MENCIREFIDTFEKNKKEYKEYNDEFFGKRLEKYTPTEIHLKYQEVVLKIKDYVKQFLQPPITKEKVGIIKYFLDEYDFLLTKAVKSIINFKIYLDKYKICDNTFLKNIVEIISGTLFLFQGKIENYDLMEKVMYMWCIVDNIVDEEHLRKHRKKLIPLGKFFKNEIYKKPKQDIEKYLKSKGDDILLNIVSDVYKIIDYDKTILFFEKTAKLFKYSYIEDTVENKKNPTFEEILKNSCMKGLLTFDIFFTTTSIQKDVDLPMYCMTTQLWDDLYDLREDMKNNSNTIFTISDELDRSILFITLCELTREKVKIYNDYLFSTNFIFLEDRHLFHPKLMEEIDKVSPMEDINILRSSVTNILEDENFYKLFEDENLINNIEKFEFKSQEEFIEQFKKLSTKE